ncbi:DUF1003 domain-containing protein [Frankia gtarii]|uniref:DUF1003 domain-containing protein n=1 Tax=Frankia gtarii TaxID=2950102 RepID=UPI0021C0A0CF|nr:DUF1003 domain-containing protein [Frankia gtarii]
MTISASRTTDRRGLGTERLDLPVSGRVTLFARVDRETVSRSAETIARFLGTGRYLAIQTGIVIVWIALNIALPLMRWDPYPFILLNLAFSTQAAYAAPLILLAQNRQDDRDRASLTEDRAVAGRMRENTEFLTREVAALRLAQSEAATRQYVRGELAGQLEALRGDLTSLLREAVEIPRQPQATHRSGASSQPSTSCQPDPHDHAARGTGSTDDADGPSLARAKTAKHPKGAKRARPAKVTATKASLDAAIDRSSPADGSSADGLSADGSSADGSPAGAASPGTASEDATSSIGASQARHASGISRSDETEPGAPSSGPTSAHLVASAVEDSHPALPTIVGRASAADPADTDAARADTGTGGTATHRTPRAAPGRGHHRSPLHAGSARRSAERSKSGDSPTADTSARHVS